MSAVLDRGMEVEVVDADGVSDCVPSDLHVSGVGNGKRCFILLGPEEVDRMDGTVFFHEASEVSIKSRL